MQETFWELIETMGGRVWDPELPLEDWGIKKGGEIIHEVGTTAMGEDPKKSVLNQFCQSWDVKNLFVTDGGCFASNADKNPTLSIMAVAWRASDYIADQVNRRNV
jgi:choline dehydrogenase-like flavoprotein